MNKTTEKPKKRIIRTIVPYVAIGLLFGVLITAHFSLRMNARYRTSVAAVNTARVAAFAVGANANSMNVVIDRAVDTPVNNEYTNANYIINAQSTSEVSVEYDVTINFASSPYGQIQKVALGEETWTIASGETSHTFTDVGTFTPSSGTTLTNQHPLTFTVGLGPGAGTGLDYDNDIISGDSTAHNFTVTVRFDQID